LSDAALRDHPSPQNGQLRGPAAHLPGPLPEPSRKSFHAPKPRSATWNPPARTPGTAGRTKAVLRTRWTLAPGQRLHGGRRYRRGRTSVCNSYRRTRTGRRRRQGRPVGPAPVRPRRPPRRYVRDRLLSPRIHVPGAVSSTGGHRGQSGRRYERHGGPGPVRQRLLSRAIRRARADRGLGAAADAGSRRHSAREGGGRAGRTRWLHGTAGAVAEVVSYSGPTN
jgi:hypothetical protein